MIDNEQIVADLEWDKSAYYYSMNGSHEVIREVYRDKSGKLFIKLHNWGTVPLEMSAEKLLGRVLTYTEFVTMIKCMQEEFADQVMQLQAKIEAREELLLKLCLGEKDPLGTKEAAEKAIRDHLARRQKEVKG